MENKLKKKQNYLNYLHFFFYLGVGALVPFLGTHMTEIGITEYESSIINTVTSFISVFGPLIALPLMVQYMRYKLMITFSVILSSLFYLSLLFVPKVIRTPYNPNIVFDCSSNQLRIEQCPNWNQECNFYSQQQLFSNFSNFVLTDCHHVCDKHSKSERLTMYDSDVDENLLTPIEICFTSSSEGDLCVNKKKLEAEDKQLDNSDRPDTVPDNDQMELGKYQQEKKEKNEFAKFDSRFDRWRLMESNEVSLISSYLNTSALCIFQPTSPLLINNRPYEQMTCRSSKPNCKIQCNVKILQRKSYMMNANEISLPCFHIKGNPKATFYSYLILRIFGDLFLLTSFAILDALSVTLTNNYDKLYGGFNKLMTIYLPLIISSIANSFLIDYYSKLAGRADYSPTFIINVGIMVILSILVMAFPSVFPISRSMKVSIDSESYMKTDIKLTFRSKVTLLIIFLLTIIHGSLWNTLNGNLYSYYLKMNQSRILIGCSFAITFITFIPFVFIIKSLISALNSFNLIILGFIFFALRLFGISLLYRPTLILIPFQAMDMFTLIVTWIGITSLTHNILTKSFAPLVYLNENDTINTMKKVNYIQLCKHIKLHCLLIVLYFAIGRCLGSFGWAIWQHFYGEEISYKLWFWLKNRDIDFLYPNTESFRIYLRLLSLFSLLITFILLILYKLMRCCKRKPNYKRINVNQNQPPPNTNTNGTNAYCKLVDKANGNQNDKQSKDENAIKMIDE